MKARNPVRDSPKLSLLARSDAAQPIHQALEQSSLRVLIAVADAHSSGVAPDLGGQEQKAHEVAATSKDNKASSAISSDNYAFNYIGEATLDGQSCYVLGLKPKRTENDLISGEVWIDKHSFLIRQIQGEVEKMPSWWLTKVRIKLVFADLEGVWVQTSMEATADVRIVGAHTLTSRILDYRREEEVAATPLPGGSNLRKR
jgi:hypothetical protein